MSSTSLEPNIDAEEYTAIEVYEDIEASVGLLDKQPQISSVQGENPCSHKKSLLIMLSGLILLNMILLFANITSVYHNNHLDTLSDGYQNASRNQLLKETSSYSPILDVMDLSPSFQILNGALRDNTSIWRKAPSPEVDAAWDFISTEDMQIITIPSSSVLLSGKDPNLSVKAPESWNLGNDAYIAQVEVFHQINCLNMLRKDINYDYYYHEPSDELHRSHTYHCIHMLLQNLMCKADVGVITHYWVHNEGYIAPTTRPFPDFNTVTMCRDFDGLMSWLREEGGVKDFEEKFPIKFPTGSPVVEEDGYVSM